MASWHGVGVSGRVSYGVPLYGFAVKMGIRWGSSTDDALLYLFRRAGTPKNEMITMAKTDSFFIRGKVDTNGLTYAQASIDLGSYVDALGKSVLRIHNISVEYGTPLNSYAGAPNSSTQSCFQLTTQSQTGLVDVTDRSLIASGTLAISTDASAVTTMDESMNVSPQEWTKGYLVAVEQLYLATDQTFDHVNQVAVVLECTVETLSQSAAMALALSQQ